MKSTLKISALAAAVLLTVGSTANAVVTNFSTDVAASIDKGLVWQDANGAYTGSAGDASGLSLLALLEKRQGADPNALSQGYAAASVADKARMDSAVAFILASHVPAGFYAYRDGADMMALSVYLLTGGPNPGVPAAINTIFDRTILNQGGHGYWCYTDGSCLDSSTTQLVVAGLASVRSVYSSVAHADAARLAQLNTAATAAKNAYVANGLAGEVCSAGGILTATERGHGYNVGSCNSPQQTASGTWIQLVGGSTLNDPSIQGYLEWQRNRYRYTSTGPSDSDGWPSYWYYLWSSSKAYSFIEDSGATPIPPTNLTPAKIGILPPGDAPAFAAREVHLDCAAIPRVPLFGAGAAGYYCDPAEPKRVYFDYAYTILTHQVASGQYIDFGGTSRWNDYSAQAYALLVLQRSVGGGCIDSDGDGVCDSVDNCPAKPNPDQKDTDGDGVGDVCDNCPTVPNRDQKDSNGNGVGDACEATCDVDNDGDVDQLDLSLISRNRGKPVPSIYDTNKSGKIDPADVKFCVPLCTRPNCATSLTAP
jgi:hypothetical protein